jgi:predicted MFS family arabinose efflux permease
MPFTLYWLALGAFCVGTEGFMIAALLPAIAGDLGVSVAAAGQLVTIFALTYAVGSPVLSTLLGGLDRKALLVAALAAFALANLVAAAAPSFAALMTARILLALAAGLYMPTANSVAAMLVAPERRGRAIATVIGGLTAALALGVPIGAFVGSSTHWRATFAFVAAVSAFGALGLVAGLPRHLPRGTATLAERVAVGRRPEVLAALGVTFLWATGAFCFYTFIAAFLTTAIGFDAARVPAILFLFGVAGWIGNRLGGTLTDRRGPAATLGAALLVLGLAYIAFAIAGHGGPSNLAAVVVTVGLAIGGIAGWSFHPAQSTRLVRLAPDAAVVALSLNQSALYLGSAAGAVLGALTVSQASLADLGFVAGACEFAALGLVLLGQRASAPVPQPAPGE